MKIPLLNLADEHTRSEYLPLPAVSAIGAHGFVSCTLPLARIGSSRAWHLMVLVPYEARSSLERDHGRLQNTRGLAESCISATRMPDTRYTAVALNGGGRATHWYSGEALWVDARWLAATCAAIPESRRCVSTELLRRAVAAALELCKPAEGGSAVRAALANETTTRTETRP